MSRTPIVAIIGRTNVGKSTLFNRIIGQRKAIVDDKPQVTRDVLVDYVTTEDGTFALFDTAGFVPEEYIQEEIEKKVIDQALNTIEQADLILFVVDGRAGIHPYDEYIAQRIMQKGKRAILVVNKVDNERILQNVFDFYRLGISKIVDVSAIHNRNVRRLVELISDFLPSPPKKVEKPELNLAIVGRPNVGKSSLFNLFVGKNRSVTDEVAGTTRDAIDELIRWHGKTIRIVDTAGIRRKKQIEGDIEYYSVLRAMYAVSQADVVIQLIDAVEGITSQDKKILSMILNAGKPVLLAINKWDLVEKDAKTYLWYDKHIASELKFAPFIPHLYISCLEKKNIHRLYEEIFKLFDQYCARIETADLNKIFNEYPLRFPTSRRGKKLKIYYVTQVAAKPPQFVVFINDKRLLTGPIERQIVNFIRKHTFFKNIPIILKFRGKK